MFTFQVKYLTVKPYPGCSKLGETIHVLNNFEITIFDITTSDIHMQKYSFFYIAMFEITIPEIKRVEITKCDINNSILPCSTVHECQ